MSTVDVVLVATDLSSQADEAIRQADEFARASGATLVALHTVPRGVQSNPLFPERNIGQTLAAPGLLEAAGDAVERRVLALTGRTGSDLRIVIDHGAATTCILQQIDELQAGLVVLGSHGRSGLRRTLLGSVAERVVRYAPCAALVARPSPSSGQILAATDFSDPAMPAFKTALAVSRRRGAQLTVLHSLGVVGAELAGALGPLGASSARIPADVVDSARDAAMELLAANLRELGAEAERIVTTGEASEDIVEAATRCAAELVVLGRQGRTNLARIALGEVAEAVVQHAACSVLVVPLAGR